MHHNDHLPPANRHFDHHRLDAWHVAKQALIDGMAILKAIPQGYGKLKDQGQRALCSSFTLTSEAAARTGADAAAACAGHAPRPTRLLRCSKRSVTSSSPIKPASMRSSICFGG